MVVPEECAGTATTVDAATAADSECAGTATTVVFTGCCSLSWFVETATMVVDEAGVDAGTALGAGLMIVKAVAGAAATACGAADDFGVTAFGTGVTDATTLATEIATLGAATGVMVVDEDVVDGAVTFFGT